MGWSWLVGSTGDFSGTKPDSPKQKNLSATFLVRYPKNTISKFSIEQFETSVPKRPLSGMKILEDGTWRLLSFRNSQNLVQSISSIITGAIENSKN